jgi:hypothetical protein
VPVDAAEIADLRNGTRTSLYGGGFGQGTTAGDFYGWAMAFGDIDGDGFTDFLSSSANSEGPNDAHSNHEHDVPSGSLIRVAASPSNGRRLA